MKFCDSLKLIRFSPGGCAAIEIGCEMDALSLNRFHFAFTIAYHYLFPQVTMGLALLIFILKTKVVRSKEAANNFALHYTRHGLVAILAGTNHCAFRGRKFCEMKKLRFSKGFGCSSQPT
jgi:hypothetical protein